MELRPTQKRHVTADTADAPFGLASPTQEHPAVPLQTASYWVPLASHHQAGPDQARQLPSGAPSLEETQAAGDSWRELCDKHQGTALVLTRTHACVIKNSRAVGITVFPGSDRGRVAPGSSRRGLCGWGGLCGRRSTVDY